MKNQYKYPGKIKVVDLKHNICQGGARNKGIEIARGEYIGFVDSDDMVLPEMYEMLYNEAALAKADAAFIQYANIGENFLFKDISIEKDFRAVDAWNNILKNVKGKKLDDDRKTLITNELGGVWSGLWKKDIIFNNGLFFPEKLRYEDNFWNTLIRCCLNKISFVDKIGYLYRINEQSTVRKRNQTID